MSRARERALGGTDETIRDEGPRRRRWAILCLLSTWVASSPAASWNVHEDLKRTAADGAASDHLGQAIALSGDTIVVGARGDDDLGIDSGSAYVFERDAGGTGQWGQVAKLTAADGAASDHFGTAVGISGDTIVVGAPLDDDAANDSGSAYVFERDAGGADEWGQVTKLTASDAGAGDQFSDQFGWSVAISGDTIVVGAQYDDAAGSFSGSVYVFERDAGGPGAWGEVARRSPSDATSGETYGYSVSISGDTVVVGAQGDDDAGSYSGSAYVLERDAGGPDQWGEVTKLIASDAAGGDFFGWSAAVSGNTIVVGAWGDDDAGIFSGSAYVFERDAGGANAWGEVAKLTASDAATEDEFGYSVAISGDLVVVGAQFDDDAGSSSGSGYLFQRHAGGANAWGEVAKLTASDAAADDNFGRAVAIDASTAVVGSYLDDDGQDNSGSVYFFDLISGPVLSIAEGIGAAADETVEVSIAMETGLEDVAAVAFSVDYDQSCLDFDPTDADADGIPDAVAFELPAGFDATVFFDLGDGDGEIDVVIFSSPVAALADSTLVTVSFTATCTPLLGETVVVPVGFSLDPVASFGDTLGQDLTGSTADGAVEIYPGPRGDANGNGLVAAGDVSAVVLELFDGDGDFWLDTPGGSFPGSPVGSDSNADTAVDAGDLSCISRLIFGLPCGGGARAPAVIAGPWLSIPAYLPVSPEDTVVVPVRLAAQGHDVNSVVFSLDFDQALLSFDPSDDDGDGIPDAVRWNDAGATLRSVTFDPDDVGGELDFVLADLSAAPDSLADGVLVEIELLPLISGSAIDDAVRFSQEPTASFGSAVGLSVEGDARKVLFADGFESGTTGAWSHSVP